MVIFSPTKKYDMIITPKNKNKAITVFENINGNHRSMVIENR